MTDKERFQEKLLAFIKAGNNLSDAWSTEGWNADEEYGAPRAKNGDRLLTLSFDEWLAEFLNHYDRRPEIVTVDLSGMQHSMTCPKKGFVHGTCAKCEVLVHQVQPA